MALSRKMLSAMGIEAEKIEQIIEGHTESVSALQDKNAELTEQLKKAQENADKLPDVQKELDELKKQVKADAKEREGKDYDALKKEFDDYKAEQERKAVRADKETAYKEILKDAGIPDKHWAKILKYSDVDGVELDDKGKITTAKDILKAVKEEWGDHIQQTETHGANIENPPANNAGKGMTIEQIDAIEDDGERQRAIALNHELYGI